MYTPTIQNPETLKRLHFVGLVRQICANQNASDFRAATTARKALRAFLTVTANERIRTRVLYCADERVPHVTPFFIIEKSLAGRKGSGLQKEFKTSLAIIMSSSDKYDDEWMREALLFLDHPNGETDGDSHTTPELIPPQEHERATDAELTDINHSSELFARPTKLPRMGPEPSLVMLLPKGAPVKQRSIETPREHWSQRERGKQNFHPTAPRRVNKRKEEIKMLHVQSEVLQARLNVLNKHPSKCDGGLFLAGALKWKDIANQQFERRKLSERENQRLKELTSEQRRVAKSLKRIAARHAKSKIWDPLRPTPTSLLGTVGDDQGLDDPAIFSVLLASLDQMLLQTDSMLIETIGRVVHCERHDNSHVAVMAQASRIVPFGMVKTASAVWNYTLLSEIGKEQTWLAAADGSIYSEFIAMAEVGDFRGHAKGKIVMRRVDEPTRTVIVCHSLFRCFTDGELNRFFTLPMHHFLWTVIDHPPLLENRSGGDAISRIRTCGLTMPRLDVGDLNDPTREAAIEEVADMCSRIATERSENAYDIVDNMLLSSRTLVHD